MAISQRNPNAGKFVPPEGYRNLGWQLSLTNDDLARCFKAGHMNLLNQPHVREFDNSLYMHRCTDVVKICDECKHFWHIDMSD